MCLPVVALLWATFRWPLSLLDFWWHLKAGEVIVTSGSIPRTNLFSFTAPDELYILQNWLAEVILYGVYWIGGYPLLVTVNSLLLLAALLPVYHLCRESTNNTRIAAAGGYLTSITLILFGNLRPQVFSILFFAFFYWVLVRARNKRRDLLWTLPLVMLLWVNLHGAFPLALVLMVLFLGCEVCTLWYQGRENSPESVPWIKKLGLVLVLTIVATLVNPEGPMIWDYVRTVMADSSSQLFVTEWQPPKIDKLSGMLYFYGPFFLSVLVFLFAGRRLTFTELVLFLAFAGFAMTAIRNSIWFGLIIAPITTSMLATLDWKGIGQHLRRLFRRGNSDARRAAVRKRNGSLHRVHFFMLIMIVIITVLASPWIEPLFSKDGSYDALLEPQTPIAAVDFIEEQGLEGNIFNVQTFGDYLVWRLWPKQRSFFDGRVHVYGPEVTQDYRAAFWDLCWEQRLEKYHIRYLFLTSTPADSQSLDAKARASGNWRVIYEDEKAVLFEKIR
jgi:hypothetical protein